MANQFKGVMQQLNKTFGLMKIQSDEFEILRKPDRIIEVSLPVLMDNGKIKVFTGDLLWHKNKIRSAVALRRRSWTAFLPRA